MNCEQVVQQLWPYLDRELDEASSDELTRHLQECRECFTRVEFERQLKEHVRRSCDCEEAPPELRERLTRLLQLF